MLKDRPEIWNVTLEALSPLHIGTGDVLRLDYDFAVHEGRTWVINPDTLADTLYEYTEFTAMLNGAPLRDLLNASDYQSESPLFRYVCVGEPKARDRNSQVREQIKDVWDQPYIPGSSLKGALRTALFYALFEVEKMTWTPDSLGPTAKSAAEPLEERVFGRTPNTDLLRALHVSDSTPDAERRLRILNLVATKTADGSDNAAPITLEAVSAGVTFTAQVTFDSYLVRQHAGALGWRSEQTKWLRRLPQAIRGWTTRRLLADERRPRAGQWAQQFKEISDALADNQCILQLGWGGGWDSKTLGDHLTGKPEEFKKLVDKYRLKRKGEYRPGELFPKTRRVFRSGTPEEVRGELGWVRLTWEKVQ